MSDIVQLQDFLYYGMLSCDLFSKFNIVQEKQFLMQKEIEFDAIWLTARNGVSGAGYYVEMPKLTVPRPNSLQRNLVASILAIEERNVNMTPVVGTLMAAEDMAELALDFMFGWVLGFSSALTPETGAVMPDKSFQPLMAYRAEVSLRREHHAVDRCDPPTITEDSPGTFSLANGTNTPDAQIYFTLDSSLPGKGNIGPASLYQGPIPLNVGDVINWAAWRFDRLPSHIQRVQIT